MAISIIIPTFNNVKFLPELVESIIANKYEDVFEVLFGIDNCQETLKYVKTNKFPDNFKFFFFLENGGPYIIKNTLAELSKYDKILFFDSDDVMLPQLILEIDLKLNDYHVVKPKYVDFFDKQNKRIFHEIKNKFGEGVFGIRKDLFMLMNGFEGWSVVADSDFMGRLYKTNKKILHTSHILFHRRLHPNSLTIHPDTGLSSKKRSILFNISKKKTDKDFINKEFKKSEYYIVDTEIQNEFLINKNLSISEYEEKKNKHEKISSIFLKEPKDPNKVTKIKNIDYNKINQNIIHSDNSRFSNAIKKAKLENIKKNFGK